jgi:ActR/RegA family two-component response regulator
MTVGLRRKSILIVDDNQHVQNTLRDIALAASFDVTTAASRTEAFEAIRRRRFEIALVDMRLYEADRNNRDGLDIIRHLSDLHEGTICALLTGYGSYDVAVEAHERLGAHTLSKGDMFREDVERLLRQAVEVRHEGDLEPARAWSAAEQPDIWLFHANSVLRPKGDYGVTLSLLQELLLTCDPLREYVDARGLEKLQEHAALGGLYWSRGVGEAVIVLVARDQLPSPIPLLPHWPAVTVQDEMYRTSRKNLWGAIMRCAGVGPEAFPVKRSPSA